MYSNRKYVIGLIFIVIALIYIYKLFSIQVMDSSYKLSASPIIPPREPIRPPRALSKEL